MNWIFRMNEAVQFVEENLLTDLKARSVSEKVNSSEFHFQRVFYMLTGFTLQEYIRKRRLSLAAQDYLAGGMKVIDIAMKYGYESPEAFTRAYTSFHGVSPRNSLKPDVNLKIFPKISFSLSVKGSVSINYRIISHESFLLKGKSMTTSNSDGRHLNDVPAFWKKSLDEGFSDYLEKEASRNTRGLFPAAKVAVSFYKKNDSWEKWSYLIGIETDKDDSDLETIRMKPHRWAVFECRGAVPEAVQETWKRIYSEWFPSSNYEHAGGGELEVYYPGNPSASDYYCEIWIPVTAGK